MIFLRAKIDGFGKWLDTSFEFQTAEVNGFYGENESGKSTLQQFLLYMLFGLPPRMRKRYTPKQRQGIGGSLRIQSDRFGQVTLKRQEGECSCLLENGDIKKEDWWIEQLGGLTRDVYTSIYAFTATDLSAIRTMKQADMSELLFSVGLSGSTAIYQVEKELLSQQDALYKKQGRKPILNEQIDKTSTTSKELHEVSRQEAEYDALHEEISKLGHTLQMDQKQLEMNQKQLITIEKTKQIVPLTYAYHTNKAKLAALPVNIPFPEHGIERYQHIKEMMLPVTSELHLLQQKEKEDKDKYNQLLAKRLTSHVSEQAKTILAEKSAYERRTFKIEQLEKTTREKQDTYNDLLQQLAWESDETNGMTLPFHLETEWQDIVESNRGFTHEQTQLDEANHLLTEKRRRLTVEEKNCQNNMLPDEEIKQLKQRLEQAKLVNEQTEQVNRWQEWEVKQKRTAKTMLFIAAGLATLTFILALWSNQSLLYIFPFLLILVGGLQYLYSENNKKTIGKVFAGNGIEITTEEQKRYEALLQKETEKEQRLFSIKHDLREIHFSEIQLDEQNHLMIQKESQLRDRIETERFQYPFLTDVDPTYWPDLLKCIRQLKATEKEWQQSKKEMAKLQEANRVIDEQLENFHQGIHFSGLEEMMELDRVTHQSLKQSDESMIRNTDKISKKQEELNMYQMEIKPLFSAADVEDEEAFYERASQLATKKSLEKELASITQQLHGLFSPDEVQALLQKQLDETELESKEFSIRKMITDVTNNMNVNNRKLATLEMQVKTLESSDGASMIKHRLQLEKNLLNEQAKKWSMLKIASAILQNAKQSFQENHLSDVMSWTTHYFYHLTGGHYKTVYPPTEASLFRVEGKDEVRYTVEELSQGTVDQLYVALRLAIAKVMHHTFQIPLLVDDAFVHFDDIRTEKALQLLEEIASEQQIIFFTCKGSVAEWIQPKKVEIKD
jgi:uncharacterized protein YhaN